MYVLGLNIRHGDSSACIFRDGQLIAAVEEERFVRVKNTSRFPINSIKYCLNQANIAIDEINYITHNSNFSYNISYMPSYFFVSSLYNTIFFMTIWLNWEMIYLQELH